MVRNHGELEGRSGRGLRNSPANQTCQRAHPQLAKTGLWSECKDRKVFRRIADRARLLTLVPENLWWEISWSEPEEDD